MPKKFYPDIDQTGLKPFDELCYNTITGFDGPFICKRPKNHKVDSMRDSRTGDFHQEEYEGWVWDDEGLVD